MGGVGADTGALAAVRVHRPRHDDRARSGVDHPDAEFRGPGRRLVRAAAEQRLYLAQTPFAARAHDRRRGSQHHGRRSAGAASLAASARVLRGCGAHRVLLPRHERPSRAARAAVPAVHRVLHGCVRPGRHADGGRRDLRRLRRRDRDGDYILAPVRGGRRGSHARRRARRRVRACARAPRRGHGSLRR